MKDEYSNPIPEPTRLDRILTVAYLLCPVMLYLLCPVITAIGFFLYYARGIVGWGLGILLGGIASFAGTLVFGSWVVRWGRRRFGAKETETRGPVTASAAAPAENMPKDRWRSPDRLRFAAFMSVASLALNVFGIAGIVDRGGAAITAFRRQAETTGVRVETRIVDKPHQGQRWTEEGLMEYTVNDQVHREWLETRRYKNRPSESEFTKSDKDVGEKRSVWYDPHDPSQAELSRPEPWSGVRGAVFGGVLVLVGLFLANGSLMCALGRARPPS
jgi:hypothetical protein